MMQKVVLFGMAVILSGCSNHPFNAINSTSYQDGKDASGNAKYARAFAWDSTYSAGIGNSNGMCVQGALTANSSSFSAALDVAAEKLAAKGRGGIGFAEAVMALNASSVQTAYANSGYFYLCQVVLNQMTSGAPFTGAEVVEMWKDVGDTAQNIKVAATDLSSLSAPELDAFRAYLEKLGVPNIPESDEELQEAIVDATGEEDDDGGDNDEPDGTG